MRELSGFPDIRICILYGSYAHGMTSTHSDVDLGICGKNILPKDRIATIASALAIPLKSEVDVVDISAVSGIILHKILSKGIPLLIKDHKLYARHISRMLYNQADMMPYYTRILRERRERFLNG
jgi:predicted nucleotidyltransferase